jgi:lysyl-tRNA synthetase, class II
MNEMEQAEHNEYRAQRMANMEQLRQRGMDPFGAAFERTGRLAELRAGFEEEKPARAAGRVTSLRDMGKSLFAHLQDASDRFQIFVSKKVVGDDAFEAFKYLDLGDFIGVEGALFVTRTGEQTLRVDRWTMLSKALLPLPEKFHGLQDVELRYRQRYLDLIANPEVCALFQKRTAILRAVREFLFARGYLEVETPMMQPMAGGAAARPFETFYNALQTPMYLRIAPELYLKRLLVGGLDRVFELNRNFRNEGLDRSHNPEFTMLELYEAYGDVRSMKALIETMVTGIAESVMGTLQVGSPERPIDLTPPWREASYHELIRETAGADWDDLPMEQARARAEGLGLTLAPEWNKAEITHEVYEKIVEKIADPSHVRHAPARGADPAGQAVPGRPLEGRRLRTGDRRQGNRAGLHGTQRSDRTAQALCRTGGRGRVEAGRGFPGGDGTRHAPGRGHGRGDRPPDHDPDRGRIHPRRPALPADEKQGIKIKSNIRLFFLAAGHPYV